MLLDVLLLILGLIFGSFFSAYSFRYAKGISVLKGRSFCDNCHKKISWYDNIPVLSFLILGGRCRDCHKKISWRYPLIELSTAIGFFLIGVNLVNLLIFSILVLIFVIDMENQIIPDSLVFFGIGILLIFNFSLPSLLAGMLCATFLLLINLITRGRGMGLGDVKFAILGGYLVGLPLSFIWLTLAFLTGGIVSVILILGKKAKLKQKIAFGPFLIIAVPLALIYGEKILSWLYSN
jgi:leader peptidase (prepilin peptidase) / N-methyltransferase